MTSKSHSGWVITYAGCPITWTSKLQTVMALSTTEAEYVALSIDMREQLPLLCLLKEVVEHKIDTQFKPAMIHCKGFERQQRCTRYGKGAKDQTLH